MQNFAVQPNVREKFRIVFRVKMLFFDNYAAKTARARQNGWTSSRELEIDRWLVLTNIPMSTTKNECFFSVKLVSALFFDSVYYRPKKLFLSQNHPKLFQNENRIFILAMVNKFHRVDKSRLFASNERMRVPTRLRGSFSRYYRDTVVLFARKGVRGIAM